MCQFEITYEDKESIVCPHITSVTYTSKVTGSRVDVPESDLLTHGFPVGATLWLHAEGQNFCISGNGVRSIEILAE